MNYDQESSYPINKKRRDGGMFPRIWKEEEQVKRWLRRQSGCEFPGIEFENGWRSFKCSQFVYPTAYLYGDYRKWKLRHMRPIGAYEMAGLMNARQFGMCLQVCLPDGWSKDRTVIVRRVCTRTGKKKNMRMLRGIKHPDGYELRTFAGRPRHDD